MQQITNTIERNMNKVSLLLLWMMLGNVLSLQAQIRGNSIEVKVVPDHQDWRYEVGETATFMPHYDKALILMRWIRRAIDNEEIFKIS